MYRALIPIVAIQLLSLVACEPAPPLALPQPTASPVPVAPIVIAALLDVQRDAGPDSLQRLDAARLAVERVNLR